MSPTPGTLYEYDMILSTSQSAINAQFENLFDTPDPDDFTQNLIPNNMSLGYTYYDEHSKTWEDTDEGLTAEMIKCPFVDINSVTESEGKNRAVRLKIKIVTGTMTYHDEHDKSQNVKVDGWSFSWIAGLGTRIIQDLDKAKMHATAKTALRAALAKVPDADFLPAAIFCTFESTTVAKSFKLYDQHDKDVSSGKDAANFLKYFTTTYSHTDHLPWVLGYSVTQFIPHPQKEQPEFWPVKCWYSTTPYPNNADQATVNFCMITSDPHDDPLVDPVKNPAAGIISPPLLDVTRSANLFSDGIFAISAAAFYKHWLKPVVMDQLTRMYYIKDVQPAGSSSSGGQGPDCQKTDEFDTGWREHDTPARHKRGKFGDQPGVRTRTYSTGTLHADVKYSSTLEDYPSGVIPTDRKRILTVNLSGYASIHTDYQTSEDYGPWDKSSDDISPDFDFTFTIGAGNGGGWDIIWLNGGYDAIEAYNYMPDISTTGFAYNPAPIMPNGDVFTFLGLDCDSQGNVYSHVKYRTID